MNSSYIKRTFRPLYGWTQMTPKSVFLDPFWDRSTPIWPGMVMTKAVGENVTLCGAGSGAGGVGTAANNVPYGFAALYVGGDGRSEEHTSELQSRENLVCRLLLEKKKTN